MKKENEALRSWPRFRRILAGILLFVLVGIPFAARQTVEPIPPEGAWATKPPMPTARASARGAVVNGILYVVGGQTYIAGSYPYLGTLEAYSPTTNTWTTLAPMPTPRSSFGIGVVNGIIYAVGGTTTGGVFVSTVEAYNPATNIWTAKTSMPAPRTAMGVGVVDGILYAIGGTGGATVVAYDPVANTWSTKTSMNMPHFGPAVGVVNGIIYVAGHDFGGGGFSNIVEAYDPVAHTWSFKPPMLTPRASAAGGVIDGKFYVIGGSGPGYFNQSVVEAYDPLAYTWSTKAPMPTPRNSMASGVIDGTLYVVGGNNQYYGSGTFALNTHEAFTPEPVCSYAISPTSQNFPATAGTGTVSVSAGSGCSWTASSNDAFITITSGMSGSGNGTVAYSVAANPTTSQRTGTMTIAGKTFTVVQEGVYCIYTIAPQSVFLDAVASTGSVSVVAPNGCAWTATSNAGFLTITSGSSGSGIGTVGYSVTANKTPSLRTGTATIAGQTFTVSQAGDTIPPVIGPVTNITVDATSPTGAVVTFALPTVTDNMDPAPSVTAVPASGSVFPVGTTTVIVTARDASGNESTKSFTVTVQDMNPPVIGPVTNLTVEATSPLGAVVTFALPTVTDNVDPAPIVFSTPRSGSNFPIGTTTVTVIARDASFNVSSTSFTVTVRDTTPPVIGPVSNLTVEATSPSGATVNFTLPTVTDNADPAPTVTASPASGSLFPIGTTTVMVTAADAAGNTSSASFTVTVLAFRDTIPPVIGPVNNITVEATSPSGATVTFTLPTVIDNVDPAPTVTASPASGNVFPIGTTTVTVTATDASGNTSSARFTVTVLAFRDTIPPVIGPVNNITVEATSPSGAVVTFTLPTVTDNVDPAPSVSAAPPLGSLFPIGTTTVTVTAADASGNTSNTSFTVTVMNASQMTSNLVLTVATVFPQAIDLVQNALNSLNKGNTGAACNQMKAFVNQVEAQSGKKLTVAQANQLKTSANNVRNTLGCQ